jgi:hypothetical protein
LKARISNLHKTEFEWSVTPDWTPNAGEFVIYDPDETHSYARLKVGDGEHMLSTLPFLVESTIEATPIEVPNITGLDAGRITD